MKRAVALFSAASVVLGVITIAGSLLVQAMETLNYNEAVDVYTYKPPNVEGQSILTLINAGSGDVFVNEVRMEPADKVAFPIRAKNIVVNRWIKTGEVLSLPITGKPDSSLVAIPVEGYGKRLTDLTSRPDKGRACFSLRIFDSELKDVGLSDQADAAIKSIDVSTTLSFSSKRSQSLKTSESRKTLSAKIMFDERCLTG